MMREVLGREVVDFSAARAARDAAATLHETVPKDEALAELHPAHAAYMSVVNQVSVLSLILTSLPALHRAIWLRGLPDVAESRPHAPKYDPSFRFPGEPAQRS